MAAAMSELGCLGVVHRYNTIEQQISIINSVKRASPFSIVGAAVGVSGDYLERAQELIHEGVDLLCVDVAHGHHILMRDALKAIREEFGDDLHIMAGNVASLSGVNHLSDWGADSVRCNIGGGSICSTRIQTGHGMPGLQTIMECAKTDRNVKIIADGGIRNSGDIVKALAAGADAIMCGSLLGGTSETPGKVIVDNDGSRWKTYRGMASKEAQIIWRGRYSSHEGVTTRVPYRGGVAPVLWDLERGVRSGFSYSGARNLLELQSKAEFVLQSSSGLNESRAHITNRRW
jgi:IMP dehydrogenase